MCSQAPQSACPMEITACAAMNGRHNSTESGRKWVGTRSMVLVLLSGASKPSILPRPCLMQTLTLWGSIQLNALHSSAAQKVLRDCPSGQAGGSGSSGSEGVVDVEVVSGRVVEVDVVSGGVVEVEVVSGGVVEVEVAVLRIAYVVVETSC